MDPTIGIALAVIIALAVFDLWVGVANDAVNFLNSAIGSRIATRRTIYAIAALGVLLGALTSNGLMEVARRGVFDPSTFYAADGTLMITAILAIYLGVMAADVLMLDLFNTFGLPTSTTVSIVSELVGASIAVALWLTPGGVGTALGVINAGPVLGIYTGIFLSVLVAFTVSAVLMFLVRLLLGHDLGRSFPRWGWLWTGVSFASLAYFVLYKGLKNAGFSTEGPLALIEGNLLAFLAVVFVVFAALGAALGRNHRVVMAAIILVGTGALGLAFAGNDLVNFIGPSVAAAQAVLVTDVDLSGKVPTPAWALLGAGGIMVVALLRSRKAHRVTDTEIRLAAHGATSQRFETSAFGRRPVSTARSSRDSVDRRIRTRSASRRPTPSGRVSSAKHSCMKSPGSSTSCGPARCSARRARRYGATSVTQTTGLLGVSPNS